MLTQNSIQKSHFTKGYDSNTNRYPFEPDGRMKQWIYFLYCFVHVFLRFLEKNNRTSSNVTAMQNNVQLHNAEENFSL